MTTQQTSVPIQMGSITLCGQHVNHYDIAKLVKVSSEQRYKDLVCKVNGVEESLLMGRCREQAAVWARTMFVALMVLNGDMHQTATARAIGYHPSMVSYSMKRHRMLLMESRSYNRRWNVIKDDLRP